MMAAREKKTVANKSTQMDGQRRRIIHVFTHPDSNIHTHKALIEPYL